MPVPEGWSESETRHRDRMEKALAKTRAAREGKINPWAVATATEEKEMNEEKGEEKDKPE